MSGRRGATGSSLWPAGLSELGCEAVQARDMGSARSERPGPQRDRDSGRVPGLQGGAPPGLARDRAAHSAQDTLPRGQGFARKESGGSSSPRLTQTERAESSVACPVGGLFFSCKCLLSPTWGDRAGPRDCPFPGVASGLRSHHPEAASLQGGGWAMRGSHFGRRPARLQTPSLTVLRRQVRPLDLPRVPQPRFPCGDPAVQPQGWRTWGDGASGWGGARLLREGPRAV